MGLSDGRCTVRTMAAAGCAGKRPYRFTNGSYMKFFDTLE